ncbi:maltose O-acetyltransferase [Sulfurifustis variabilis]|uniref:Nodulation protein L n=1 Tax=Sulfurifustis variabilis TaxID=1675686 RepID=A0A1B4V355_9GAMM|nr:sugar O-acetyltransferase [Sulfurifustis variabilis]BAU47983.1 maltose O-acetyltransferase [Sulfurifustis variabilis]
MKGEKFNMLRGEFYDPADPQLTKERRHARLLLRALNRSRPGRPRVRARIIRALFAAVGDDVWIEPPFFCDYGSNIAVGDKVFFNFNCVILDAAAVRIGSRVLFGPAVQLYAATHPLDVAERRLGLELARPIAVGDDVWIGGGAIVLPGVTIGSGTVIGAGSVVTTDIPGGVVAAGNPCKVLREAGNGA